MFNILLNILTNKSYLNDDQVGGFNIMDKLRQSKEIINSLFNRKKNNTTIEDTEKIKKNLEKHLKTIDKLITDLSRVDDNNLDQLKDVKDIINAFDGLPKLMKSINESYDIKVLFDSKPIFINVPEKSDYNTHLSLYKEFSDKLNNFNDKITNNDVLPQISTEIDKDVADIKKYIIKFSTKNKQLEEQIKKFEDQIIYKFSPYNSDSNKNRKDRYSFIFHDDKNPEYLKYSESNYTTGTFSENNDTINDLVFLNTNTADIPHPVDNFNTSLIELESNKSPASDYFLGDLINIVNADEKYKFEIPNNLKIITDPKFNSRWKKVNSITNLTNINLSDDQTSKIIDAIKKQYNLEGTLTEASLNDKTYIRLTYDILEDLQKSSELLPNNYITIKNVHFKLDERDLTNILKGGANKYHILRGNNKITKYKINYNNQSFINLDYKGGSTNTSKSYNSEELIKNTIPISPILHNYLNEITNLKSILINLSTTMYNFNLLYVQLIFYHLFMIQSIRNNILTPNQQIYTTLTVGVCKYYKKTIDIILNKIHHNDIKPIERYFHKYHYITLLNLQNLFKYIISEADSHVKPSNSNYKSYKLFIIEGLSLFTPVDLFIANQVYIFSYAFLLFPGLFFLLPVYPSICGLDILLIR
tara:strand:- start:371 stop:2302 length:1932 start_codon:yes stop_codon:yes gene_type:complete